MMAKDWEGSKGGVKRFDSALNAQLTALPKPWLPTTISRTHRGRTVARFIRSRRNCIRYTSCPLGGFRPLAELALFRGNGKPRVGIWEGLIPFDEFVNPLHNRGCQPNRPTLIRPLN